MLCVCESISWYLSPSSRWTSQIPPTSLFVCYVHSPIVARQRLGKNVTAAMNTHVIIEEFLDA
jgi:hypothetical protein